MEDEAENEKVRDKPATKDCWLLLGKTLFFSLSYRRVLSITTTSTARPANLLIHTCMIWFRERWYVIKQGVQFTLEVSSTLMLTVSYL